MKKIEESFKEHECMMLELQALSSQIHDIGNRLSTIISNGGKLFWIGNGGSAADAQHLSAQLVGRFKQERRALPSISLTTDASNITAIANDYEYDEIFSRQIEALCTKNDAVIGLTTSGNSRNISFGLSKASRMGAYTVALVGCDGGIMYSSMLDDILLIPSETTARIQEAHIFIGHLFCDYIESGNIQRV